MSFKKRTHYTGGAIFVISALVYSLTVEPTASFWDAGEFIATSYTLGIPHPPGAPLFLLIGRMFSFLSFGNPENVAFWTNMISVMFSSLTIYLLYHSTILLGEKFFKTEAKINLQKEIALISAAGIASLTYAFSDSFWFSATETEVYALSSFFTALVVWLMLKWEIIEDHSKADKFLILIAYLMGLSFGVHLLNLLAIPTLAIIFYYKRVNKRSAKNFALTLFVSCIILLTLLYGLVGAANLAKTMEIYLVNSLSLPFGSGIFLFIFLFAGGLTWGILFSIKKNYRNLNLILVSTVFVFIGYSSYLTIIIRSNYNPPVNHSNPSNILNFISYLNMESYPSRPLLYGPYFHAELVDQQKGNPVYIKDNNRYEVSYHKIENIYDSEKNIIFPRIYSTLMPEHIDAYKEILNLSNKEEPTFLNNISFFFSHQVGHMYLRYLMWNFSGRASDLLNASWLSPLQIFEKVPELIAKNKARNNYLMMPLILALAGIFFSYKINKKSFWIISSLFIMTGFALVVYINAPPIEPRERDYIFTGSFYAFSFFIGLGVLGIHKYFLRRNLSIFYSTCWTLVCLFVPVLMLLENWDDHDRSNRYFSVDVAKNILSSCEENAILFTGGDNDTYPLWYVQEVEGFRTDVRIVVLPFFNSDWFLDQNKRTVRNSQPLPLSLSHQNYRQGGLNDVIPVMENPNLKEPLDVSQYLELVRREHPAIQIQTSLGNLNYLPSQKLSLKVNKESVLNKGVVPSDKKNLLADEIIYEVKDKRLEKKDLMILDLIDTNRWERPIYFNNTSLNSINIDLQEYVIQEGDTFRLLPVKNQSKEMMVDIEVMYENLMNKYHYREMNNPDAYYHGYYNMYAASSRANFNTLAAGLIQEGELNKAKTVLNKSFETFPDFSVPYDFSSVDTVNLLLKLEEKNKADEVASVMKERADEFLSYFEQNPDKIYSREVSLYLIALQNFSRFYNEAGYNKEANMFRNSFNEHYEKIASL